MKSLKLISLLLAVVICLPILASCASSGSGEDTRPPSSGVGIQGDFISADYKGEEFTFLFLQQLSGQKDYYGGNYLDSETVAGLTVEDAVYKRNLATEEKYNVVINQRIESAQEEEPSAILKKFAMAGDYSFDVIYGWGYKMGACIVENLLGDMSTLPNVNFTQEYWSPSAMNELTVNGKLYITINDISMNKLEWGSLLFFNKQIVEDYGLEEKIGNFYDLVNTGKWTLDNYLAAVTSVSTDVDGSGSIDITDTYGVNTGNRAGADIAYACGVQLATKNDDGTYTLAYYSDTNLDLAKKINEVYKDTRYVKDYTDLGVNPNVPDGMEIHQYYRSFFASGHSLFCTGTANITGEFRNMEYEYGVIPLPKKDENQANYISTIDSNASLFAIPSTYRQNVNTAGPDRTGAILEYMAAASNQLVLPAYYETMLKGQRLNSEQDKAMLDLIRNNIHYIFTDMMGVEGLREIGTICSEMFKNPNSASSANRQKKTVLQKALNDFYADVLKLDTQTAN